MNPKTLNKRKGVVRISPEFFDMGYETLRALFSEFYPKAINGDFALWRGDLDYYGVSPHFDIVEEGDITPQYQAEFKSDEDGVELMHFIKL